MIRKYGWRPDKPDARDIHYKMKAIKLPPVTDLRLNCPPVMDQGNLGSCTAHGITGALRYCMIKQGQGDFPMSRLQLYYDERAMEGTVNADDGAEIRDGIKSANTSGVAHEMLWPYVEANFKTKPPTTVYEDAVHFEALRYERVRVGVSAIMSALAEGFPVVIGITVYDSFESDVVAKTGMVPVPDPRHDGEAGGHCMYCVGYNFHPNTFTVRNSWGTDWGDKGDCYIPFNYLGNPELGGDYWAITQVGPRSGSAVIA